MNDIALPAAEMCKSGSLRPPTPRENLAMQKEQLESRLTDVNAAIAALDANPEIEKVLTLVGKTMRY